MNPQNFTILVVDDDSDACLIMQAALRKAGYLVRIANSGAAAMQAFRESTVDLVMLDVDMPGMDGHEVCALMRHEAGPLLPIVMVTGMDDLESVEQAYQHGATDFIAKPVNWALVGHRVRYLFRGYEAMRNLREEQARNAAILDAIPDLLFEIDQQGRCIDCRIPANLQIGFNALHFQGRNVAEILAPDSAQSCMKAIHDAFENGYSSGARFGTELGGREVWFELSISRKTIGGADAANTVIMMARDITERRVIEARIAHLAYNDHLTGLPNRQSFLERVDREITRAAPNGAQLAVLFMDLDGFKNVNDTLGHACGDLLLKWTAERLRNCLRPSDMLSRQYAEGESEESPGAQIARLGGDEFTALLCNIRSPLEAVMVANRIGDAMRQPFSVEGRDITLTSSVGIAIYPDDGMDAATLLKHVDTAMYHAKRSGRDNTQVYSASLTQEIVRRMELESAMRAALDRDEFFLAYQPQIDVLSGRMKSVEALIRWRHPTLGMVAPLDFIPLAEETGLIEQIGEWVLRKAAMDAQSWAASGNPLTVAVNLSPLQISSPMFAERILRVLQETRLAPPRLEVEVTEGALMENSDQVRQSLNTLREQGIVIALDDFGTGYSSLAYLTRMPISHIKVDRCFVSGLLVDAESAAILRAILAMSKSLGLRVTAEGVESREQVLELVTMGCDALQGYYFSRPVPADQIPPLFKHTWDTLVRGANPLLLSLP